MSMMFIPTIIKHVNAILTASGTLDSSGIDLFVTANDEQAEDWFPPLSSLPSGVRPRGLGGVRPNPDGSETDELSLENQIEQLWCLETAVLGAQNIPVCKSDGWETSDATALSDPSELPLYEAMITLSGNITLQECNFSMSPGR